MKYKEDVFLQHYRSGKISNANIADCIRLLLLRDYGGIYLDVDAIYIKSLDTILDKLHSNITFLPVLENKYQHDETSFIEVAVMGSISNNIMVYNCLSKYTNINWCNGGKMLSDKLILELDETVALFNYRYFYDT